jgi:Gluconate 2-dehydrogenase subunit 3
MPYRAPGHRAITPQHRGRFPGFDVLAESDRWDDVTAGVVLARLAPTTDLSFFSLAENGTVTALMDLLLAQDGDPRVPVVAMSDARPATGETDGWHHDDMPHDDEAWRCTLAALDDDARGTFGVCFGELDGDDQAVLVQAVQDADGDWHGMPAQHVWSIWTRYACTAFYSHPWAWNEIGFPGPAYPRGYLNLGTDAREHWEAADRADRDPVPEGTRRERAVRRRAGELVEDR